MKKQTIQHSSKIQIITLKTRRVPVVEQELLTIPEHLSSPFIEIRVTRSLVLYVCFLARCLSFCPFSFENQ